MLHISTLVYMLVMLHMTVTGNDYYGTLGIPNDATEQQIRKAFHKLAAKYHPDKSSSPDAEAIFREIAEAYEVLSNNEKRKSYDALGCQDRSMFWENSFDFSMEEFLQGFQFDQDQFYDLYDDNFVFQEESVEVTFSVSVPSIRVTTVVKSRELVFMVKSQQLSGSREHKVDRMYEDFEWLQHSLLTQDQEPGLLGIIFPPLPGKPCDSQSISQTRITKQLGLLGLGEDWQHYCRALEKYLQLVAAHRILSKSRALLTFFTHVERPGKQFKHKSLFSWLSQTLEEKRKENHKDVDDFFQDERANNLVMTRLAKSAADTFLEVVLTEQKIALACGHFSTTLHLFIWEEEEPAAVSFSKLCLNLSEIIETVKKKFESVAENNVNTLGMGLHLEYRYQEAEKEMLFRRTCKLIELENINKNQEKAKTIKKDIVEEVRNAAKKEFKLISDVARLEVEKFHRARVQDFQQCLVSWCETQLCTAQEIHTLLTQHLLNFRKFEWEL